MHRVAASLRRILVSASSLSVVFALVAGASLGQTADPEAGADAARIRDGSRLERAPRTSPGFTTRAATVVSDPADERWDDRFALPYGVDNYGTDLTVTALAADGRGNVYVGGWFTVAGGLQTYCVAKWDGANWSALGTGITSAVEALAMDRAGNLFAGGGFGVMKWDGSAWSALGSGLDDEFFVAVKSMVTDATGNLYVGGRFQTAGGASAANVAKWDGSAWSALGAGIPSNSVFPVAALAMDGTGNLYAGGSFRTAGDVSASNIAKWDGAAWSALRSGMGGSFTNVDALVVDEAGILYAGGAFSTAGGVSANRVAKWDGTAWSALGTGADYRVYALALDDAGNLYAGGALTRAGGVSVNRVARWDGTAWSALGSGVDSYVRALAVDAGGRLWAGGEFTVAGGRLANHVARWDGSAWWAPGPGTGHGVNSIIKALAADPAGGIYAGGVFTAAGGTLANRVARWDGTGWSALGTGTADPVEHSIGVVDALVTDRAGTLYAGGSFTVAGGVSVNHVAKWDGAAWSALGAGTPRGVTSLVMDPAGNLYAGGFGVNKWDGTTWTTLGSGMDAFIWALAADGAGSIYAGGSFTSAGGVPASHVAMWDGIAWRPLGAGISGEVFALAVDPVGHLYAGGYFQSAGGASARGVAMWDGTSWSAMGAGLWPVVYALTVDATGNLYAGGGFAVPGAPDSYCLAKWDGATWSALGSGLNDQPRALALDRWGNLFAGGYLSTAGGKTSSHFALWHTRHTITASAGPGGSITPSGAVPVDAGTSPTFTLTPDPGYAVADVRVDGTSVGAVTRYTFPNVTADHSIAASFALAVGLRLEPRVLNLGEAGGRAALKATLVLPAPFSALDVDLGSVRLNGVAAAERATATPGNGQGHSGQEVLVLRFLRSDLTALLPDGEAVPIVVSGSIGGVPFAGRDAIAVMGGLPATAPAGTRAPESPLAAEASGLEGTPATGFAACRPNPSAGPVVLRYGLARAGEVSVAIYDPQGRRVRTLVSGARSPGWHEAIWDGRDESGAPVGPGIYIAGCRADGRVFQQRLVRIR